LRCHLEGNEVLTLRSARCLLRPYRMDDAAWLPGLAGDFAVTRWMAATFPHPYTQDDATSWVTRASAEQPVDNFVIEIDGAPAGGIGLREHGGESRGVAEFGYWLGRRFWGRGIATQAAHAFIPGAFAQRDLRRLEAHVFSANAASARVLEKCGFLREAVLREALTDREGVVMDAWLYAQLR